LNEELQRLYDEDVNEQDAYDQVKDDSRFDGVRLSKVTAIYTQFRSHQEKKQIDPYVTELLRQTIQLSCFQTIVECDHKKNGCLKFWMGDSSDGRFFLTHDDEPINESESNSDLKDVFSNKSCRIKVPTVHKGKDYDFWPLIQDFGLLIEQTDYDGQGNFSKYSLNLLELDWTGKKIQKIHTLEFEDQQRRFYYQTINVDVMDPIRFLLQNWHDDGSVTLKTGRVNDDKILFEEDILLTDQDIGIGFCSLFGNTLYSFDPWKFVRSNEACVYVTRLDQDAQTTLVDLSPLPEQFSIVGEKVTNIGCLAMDRLYLLVQNKQTKIYGIIWAKCETRNWELTSFFTKNPITRIEFMIDGHFLLVQTVDSEIELISDVHQMRKTFYRIPLKKPEKLTHLAWFSLVRSKSKMRNVDPYEEASKYLPYTSEIRCPFDE